MKFRLIIDKEADEEIIARVHSPNNLTDTIENLVLSYTGKDTLPVYTEEEILHMPFSDIECITLIDRKLFVIDSGGNKYRTGQRLCDLEEILPSYFIRINKSTIANQNHILRFHTVYNGSVDAIFKCGYRDYVSRRCFADIKRRFYQK